LIKKDKEEEEGKLQHINQHEINPGGCYGCLKTRVSTYSTAQWCANEKVFLFVLSRTTIN
jgi:hypothetical protein